MPTAPLVSPSRPSCHPERRFACKPKSKFCDVGAKPRSRATMGSPNAPHSSPQKIAPNCLPKSDQNRSFLKTKEHKMSTTTPKQTRTLLKITFSPVHKSLKKPTQARIIRLVRLAPGETSSCRWQFFCKRCPQCGLARSGRSDNRKR